MRAACLALLLLAAAQLPVTAAEIWQRGDAQLAFSGSLREIALATRQTDPDAFAAAALAEGCGVQVALPDCRAFELVGEYPVGQSLTRLRTRFDLQISDALSLAVAYDHQLFAGRIDSLESRLLEAFAADSFLGAEGTILDRRHLRWTHSLYRAHFRFEGDRADLVLGRQRVAWGVGRLWNPIDRFNPTPPLAIQGDESAGVDAALLRVHFDGFSFLEAVYAPGAQRAATRAALRLHGVWLDSDWSLVAGIFERAPAAGLDFARNLGGAAARLELVYTRPDRKRWPIGAPAPREPDPFWQLVVSADGNADLGSGLYLLVEHLYNGNAQGFGQGRAGPWLSLFETAPTAPGFRSAGTAGDGGSRVVSGARHQTGVNLGYDLTPELRLDVVALYDWSGSSAVFFPTLRYAPGNVFEVTLGAQASIGPRRSEFGWNPATLFVLVDFFF